MLTRIQHGYEEGKNRVDVIRIATTRRRAVFHRPATLDVGDDLLARGGAAFDRRAAEMGQAEHLRQRRQTRIDRRLALEHVEPGPGEVPAGQRGDQRLLVDQVAAAN